MITAVEVLKARGLGQSGQSIIEVLLMLPLLLSITVFMIRTNTAAQVSIVNQQYARAQTLFLTFGSPVYPRTGLRDSMVRGAFDQMVIGVSENLLEVDEDLINRDAPVRATVQRIVAAGKPAGSNEPNAEPRDRGNVRVRTTVALCTQLNTIGNAVLSSSTLNAGSQFAFCRSPYE